MSKHFYKELYQKYKTKSLSPTEKEDWARFVSDPSNDLLLQELLNIDWHELDSEQNWKRLPANRERRILEQIMWIEIPKSATKVFTLARIVSIAALLLACLLACLFFYKNDTVLPGKNQAYLLMSDGTKIELSSLQSGIAFSDGSVRYIDSRILIDNNSNVGGMLSLVTPKGGQYQLLLEDGSRIWLNADSRLNYPAQFLPGKPREVNIEGEAFFSIKHDAKRPFIVHTDKQEVRVLGTEFAVSAYKDDPYIKTTLLNGSVSLHVGQNKILLKPDQQAVLQGDKINLYQIKASEALAWTKGEFVLENEPLESIMRKLSRWYNVEVIYDNDRLKQQKYEGVLNRFEQIDDLLQLLEKIGDVNFKRSDRKIYVSYKN